MPARMATQPSALAVHTSYDACGVRVTSLRARSARTANQRPHPDGPQNRESLSEIAGSREMLILHLTLTSSVDQGTWNWASPLM